MTPKQIKAKREQLGMTQEEFAAALGVSFVTVNRWENGHNSPSPLAVAAIKALK